jgi:lipid-binding SYLF domain-containing protein
MKQRIRSVVLAVFSVIAALSAVTAQAEDLRSECKQAITSFNNADPGMQNLMNNSAGYAVFPNVGKGGFIVGGAHGKGLVFEKGKLVGEARMSQASIGAQAGGQTFSEIIFFETPTALNEFKSSNFEMSAEAGAIAAAEGASRVARYSQGVAVFTLPKKGLMVQASVGGQKFKFKPITESH